MPLQRGEVQRYDFDRMTVEFTMLNQGKVIMCAISTGTTIRPLAFLRAGRRGSAERSGLGTQVFRIAPVLLPQQGSRRLSTSRRPRHLALTCQLE